MNRRAILVTILVAAFSMVLPVVAQEGPEPGMRPGMEQRKEMFRQAFQQKLRSTLSLTDEQMEAIAPRLLELEEHRNNARRERHKTVRALREGMEQGMGDEELQGLLDHLDEIQLREMETVTGVFAEVDKELTVRQRVQLRFFIDQFRKRIREKAGEFRRGRGPGRGLGRGGGEWRQ